MVADDASRIPNVTLAANIRKIGFVNDPRFDRVARTNIPAIATKTAAGSGVWSQLSGDETLSKKHT